MRVQGRFHRRKAARRLPDRPQKASAWRGNQRCDEGEASGQLVLEHHLLWISPSFVRTFFPKALEELTEEGGIPARFARYKNNNDRLRELMGKLGIHAYISPDKQSPIITTFLFPTETFDFKDFYNFIKERGYVIYPGKLTDIDTFRIGNIGEIHEEDIEELGRIVEKYMKVVTV